MLGLLRHRASRLGILFLLLCELSGCRSIAQKQDSGLNKVETDREAAVSSPVVAKEPVKEIDTDVGHARTYFRRHEYQMALLALEGKTLDIEALWISAESLFRLGKFNDAKTYFDNIINQSKDPIERRKASIRLFDVDLYAGNIQDAINRYVAFGKAFKTPSARMRYGLGKALFDIGYFDRSLKVLRGIPKDSEFFIRARYIIASIGIEKRKPEASAKIFNQIEKLKPISVEDYAVIQMAILAQGRIFADANRYDLAEQAYLRVSLAGEFGVTATTELLRVMLGRAMLAKEGQGQFKKASVYRRRLVEVEALAAASRAVERFRKAHEIDWRKPELLTLMASLYVASRRYEEARLAYDELSSHYRPIEAALRSKENSEAVWYYFALDFERPQQPNHYSMVAGVPNSLVKDIPGIDEILRLRDRIERDEKKLRDLEALMIGNRLSANAEAMAEARARQDGIVNAYEKMVLNKQRKISEKVANLLNMSLAEADFKRAELVLTEMRDVKKQQNAVLDFQSEKIELFESSLKKLDEGGSS